MCIIRDLKWETLLRRTINILLNCCRILADFPPFPVAPQRGWADWGEAGFVLLLSLQMKIVNIKCKDIKYTYGNEQKVKLIFWNKGLSCGNQEGDRKITTNTGSVGTSIDHLGIAISVDNTCVSTPPWSLLGANHSRTTTAIRYMTEQICLFLHRNYPSLENRQKTSRDLTLLFRGMYSLPSTGFPPHRLQLGSYLCLRIESVTTTISN